jgi:hypothetical protein
MAGNGHYWLTTKDGTYPDIRKPNSTGLDWTHGRLTELYQMLLDMYGIMDPKQNLQTPLNCMGWTPASIPLLTTATITDGQVCVVRFAMRCACHNRWGGFVSAALP